jgi:hypothetical protein
LSCRGRQPGQIAGIGDKPRRRHVHHIVTGLA